MVLPSYRKSLMRGRSRYYLRILTALTCGVFVFVFYFVNGVQQQVKLQVDVEEAVEEAAAAVSEYRPRCVWPIYWAGQSSKYTVLYNYVPADTVFEYNASVTYTTHGTNKFLKHTEQIARRWNGPVSLAVYAPATDFEDTLQVIQFLRQCGSPYVRQFTTFHLFFDAKYKPSSIPCSLDDAVPSVDCETFVFPNTTFQAENNLSYPVNVARNIARISAQTQYLLPSDIELYPSVNLIPMFLDMIARLNKQAEQRGNDGDVSTASSTTTDSGNNSSSVDGGDDDKSKDEGDDKKTGKDDDKQTGKDDDKKTGKDDDKKTGKGDDKKTGKDDDKKTGKDDGKSKDKKADKGDDNNKDKKTDKDNGKGKDKGDDKSKSKDKKTDKGDDNNKDKKTDKDNGKGKDKGDDKSKSEDKGDDKSKNKDKGDDKKEDKGEDKKKDKSNEKGNGKSDAKSDSKNLPGQRTVFILPIFEVDESLPAPENKSELLALMAKEKVVPFHKFVCPECHRVPKQDDWLKYLSTNETLGVLYSTKRHKPYHNWEPIYIGTNDEPLYDERLNWEGMSDKMTQAYEMCLLGYNFSILDNAFLVHAPGIKHYTKTLNSWRKGYVKENSKLRKQIKKELTSKYAPDARCAL